MIAAVAACALVGSLGARAILPTLLEVLTVIAG